MIVRPYRLSDAPALALIFRRAVSETAARFYSAEQIAAWLFDPPEAGDIHEKNSDGRQALVAVDDNDVPCGWIDLESNGHVDMLFVSPDWAGRGVASLLHTELVRRAHELGIKRLFVEASEGARPIFGHFGFRLLQRRDFDLNGTATHNYAMEKLL